MPSQMVRCACGRPVRAIASKGDTLPVVHACEGCKPTAKK